MIKNYLLASLVLLLTNPMASTRIEAMNGKSILKKRSSEVDPIRKKVRFATPEEINNPEETNNPQENRASTLTISEEAERLANQIANIKNKNGLFNGHKNILHALADFSFNNQDDTNELMITIEDKIKELKLSKREIRNLLTQYSDRGYSPLHSAALHGNKPAALFFLENKSLYESFDKEEHAIIKKEIGNQRFPTSIPGVKFTPYDIARLNNHNNLVDLLFPLLSARRAKQHTKNFIRMNFQPKPCTCPPVLSLNISSQKAASLKRDDLQVALDANIITDLGSRPHPHDCSQRNPKVFKQQQAALQKRMEDERLKDQ